MDLLSRRTFATGAVGTAVVLGRSAPVVARQLPPPIADDPFTLGIASGDPLANGVVIWTRLAPDPIVDGGGMAPASYRVNWEVADDPTMSRVVRRGGAWARPHAHTVHVDVRGCAPTASTGTASG